MKNNQIRFAIQLVFISLILTSALSLYGRYVHITDIHLDNLYQSGGSISQNDCHGGSGSASQFGAIDSCDTPILLVNEYFSWLKKQIQETPVDFVLWTGDNTRHDNDPNYPVSLSEVISTNTQIAKMMTDTFGDMPIVPSIGNNDVYPHDNMPDYQANNSIYAGLSTSFASILNADQLAQFQNEGNVAFQITSDLVILSFNSILLMKKDKDVSSCSDSSSGGAQQLNWLSDQLTAVQNNNQMAMIIGHVAPVGKNYYDDCTTAYINLATQFSANIIAHQFGHHHDDEFYIANQTPQANGDCGVGLMFLNPSIMPTYNPGVRFVEYNPSYPHNLQSYTQYYTDLQTAINNNEFNIQVEYTFPDAYGLPDMSMSSFCTLYDQIQNNSTVSAMYTNYMQVSGLPKTLARAKAVKFLEFQ